jgi:hypothetical protein
MHPAARIVAVPVGQLGDQRVSTYFRYFLERKLPERQQQCVARVPGIAVPGTAADQLQTVQQWFHAHLARAAAEDELRERFRIIGPFEYGQYLLTLPQTQQRDGRNTSGSDKSSGMMEIRRRRPLSSRSSVSSEDASKYTGTTGGASRCSRPALASRISGPQW